MEEGGSGLGLEGTYGPVVWLIQGVTLIAQGAMIFGGRLVLLSPGITHRHASFL